MNYYDFGEANGSPLHYSCLENSTGMEELDSPWGCKNWTGLSNHTITIIMGEGA